MYQLHCTQAMFYQNNMSLNLNCLLKETAPAPPAAAAVDGGGGGGEANPVPEEVSHHQ